jgi:hypothetical protein
VLKHFGVLTPEKSEWFSRITHAFLSEGGTELAIIENMRRYCG